MWIKTNDSATNKLNNMGKIILEFDSFEEKEDARDALDGYKWKLAVWDIDQELRAIVKHGYYKNREATAEERNFAEDMREQIRSIVDGYGIILE
jgi:hypothetical protein